MVLVVDDEPQVRNVARRLLTTHGYRVLEASTAEEALEKYASDGRDIDLVILDFIMPGMGGRRGLERLRALDQAVPVIIASGYSAEVTSSDLLQRGAQAFVAKPYQAKTMLRVVRRVLDERASR